MNKEQLYSVVRQIIVFLAGIGVTKGWLTSDQSSTILNALQQIIPAAATLATLVWGIYQSTTANKIASVAASSKVVEPIVVNDQKLADSIPSSNVIGPQDVAKTAGKL